MEHKPKEKVKRLFHFLKQYNNIKNPIITDIDDQQWKLWLDDIPEHTSIINKLFTSGVDDTEEILIVKRPALHECPQIPQVLLPWVEKGWQQLSTQLTVKKEIKVLNTASQLDKEEDKYIYEEFEDDKERVAAFNKWKEQRDRWLKIEIPARAADNLFNTLYGLYSSLKKESGALELILGDGNLLYKKDVYIEHPVLLQHVKLEFDADKPEFILKTSDKGTEIYRSLFYYIEGVNNELLRELYDDFEEFRYSPLEVDNKNSFLNRMANAISSKGRFVESKALTNSFLEFPQIYGKPVLFLRKRNLGFGVAVDTIIEDINVNEKIPAFLKEVAGCLEEDGFSEEVRLSELNYNTIGIDENILLTKPANSEQLLVAKYLEHNSAVLVQGPPGTGKTHTIANMIGHLLSEGKSILVTSCSEKALSVLKEKVDPMLQPLCLSLLSTTESREEMERNLDEINENRSRLSPLLLKEQISTLEKIRIDQIDRLRKLKLKVKNTRLNEHRPIVINGDEFSPIDAAKFISENEKDYSWIPEPVRLGSVAPLTEEELIELYQSNIQISQEDERELNCNLPPLEDILTPLEYRELLHEKEKFSQQRLHDNGGYWRRSSSLYTIEELEDIKLNLKNVLDKVTLENLWSLEIMEASREEVTKQSWVKLVDEINKVYSQRLEIADDIIKYNPEIITLESKIDIRKQLQLLISKLETEGKVSRLSLLINSDMKAVINSCRINGGVPRYINEYKVLLRYFDFIIARRNLENRWNRQMAVLGVDDTSQMGENFETVCKKYCTLIEENLDWFDCQWNPITKKLEELGVVVQLADNDVDLSSDRYRRIKYIKKELGPKFIDILDSEVYRLKYTKHINKIESLAKLLKNYTIGQSSNIVENLLKSISEEDVGNYQKFYENLVNIDSLYEVFESRRYLLGRLYEDAAGWAKEIELRSSVHGKGVPPSGIKKAWLFVQFSQELKERDNHSAEELTRSIMELEKALMQTTSELAYKKAWMAKLISFQHNKKQLQAIEGWRQLIRKLGNGKGKRSEIYKSEARRLMPSCQGAIPVWIMPLSKVVENFNPKENRFDIVIIDEASQADVMALTALYLGRKVIIVGDNEQVSPLSIGEKTEDMDRIIGEYLYDFPNDKLYSGKFSLYDLAQASGYQPIRLKEHFRCVPDIIQYSNLLSYNGQIRPLRDDSEVSIKPATVAFRVHGAVSNNKVNEKEAETIVSLILACCELEEYTGKTFGVITLRGDRQAVLIDRMLQKRMSPAEYKKREILCGNSANFQGDERDIIFLSMVDTNEGDGPLRMNSHGNDDLYKKRYNVAVSRARDQIWLVYSLDMFNDLKPGDIRKELLEYFKNPKSREAVYNGLSKEAESEFEKDILKNLVNKGYKITPQWKVGSYRIDIVAQYGEKKVAIECDGERWHGEEKLEEDMVRQAILERLGWRFIRIRGSEYYRNKAETLKAVYDKLQRLDIYPLSSISEDSATDASILLERVKVTAERIKKQWQL